MSEILQNTSWNNTTSTMSTPFSMVGLFANLIGVFIVLIIITIAPTQLSRPFWSSLLGTAGWAGVTPTVTPIPAESAAPAAKVEARVDEPPRDPPKRNRYEAIRV